MEKTLSNKINDYIKTNHENLSINGLQKEIKILFKEVLSNNAISKRLSYLRKKNLLNGFFESRVNHSKNLGPDNEWFAKRGTSSIDKIETLSESFQLNENGNKAEFETKTNLNPKSLDELLKVCKVDTDIWKVERHIVNKWEVGAKDENGNIVTTPLYQIKAFLIRKIAIQQEIPVIQPIQINLSKSIINNNSLKEKTNISKALIIPDSHNGFRRGLNGNLIPLHDRNAWDLIIQVIKSEKFDRIILLGDQLDFAEWSDKFTKTPDFYWTTQAALIELAWWLGKIKQYSNNAKIDYLEGNHEARMPRLINNNLIAAYNLHSVKDNNPVLTVDNLLSLKTLDITYHNNYPNGEIWLNDNLCCSHGSVVRTGSGDTAKTIVQKARCSEIFGHIHRMEMACITKFSKKGPISYKAFSPGTISRIDGVVPGHSERNNWQQGFAKVEYEDGNGLFEITPITINSGKCIYNGKAYHSNFQLENMTKEINRPEYNF